MKVEKTQELKNVVERSVYRWGDAESAVEEIIIDPFISPYQQLNQRTNTAPTPINESPAVTLSAAEHKSFNEQIRGYEINILKQTLATNHNHQGRTAEALGLSYHQLRGLLRKHGLGGSRKGRSEQSA